MGVEGMTLERSTGIGGIAWLLGSASQQNSPLRLRLEGLRQRPTLGTGMISACARSTI